MAQLKELAGRRPEPGQWVVPPGMRGMNSPLVVEKFREQLAGHPDREYRDYLLEGLEQGFRIGFRHGVCQRKQAKANMKSAIENPDEVDKYLAVERQKGRVYGPLDPSEFPAVGVSRFGVIPKSHQPGKWRLIVDLSHPKGASVNDGIERDLCSLSYVSVDDAIRAILAQGRGTMLAKFDIESAYRLVSVHPDDRPLLGMRWKDQLYIDSVLPFGLRSAPKIFNALADALQWIFIQNGVPMVAHYLDDFLVLGAPNSAECQRSLDLAIQLCHLLGVPIAVHKTEGPAQVIVFLGIELDTGAMEVRLPREKLERLKHEIARWQDRRQCSKRELLSLIGQLQHACCVVRSGRTFLRRMIDLSKSVRELEFKIKLNRGFRSDLQWWACFLPSWNGTGLMTGVIPAVGAKGITSDASGSWGCGAFSSSGEWFQLELPESWHAVHITVKELLPVVLGIALWGRAWQGCTIRCRCDNAAVVAVLKSGRCKDERVMHLMRCLFFFTAAYNVVVAAEHIPGVDNGAADALSRNDACAFLLQVPSAKATPTVLPTELLQVLVYKQPDWTSVSWTRMLASFLPRV